MAVYKIRVNTPKKVQEIEAEPVTIPGFEEFQFIVHAVPTRPSMWAVSEVTTGLSVVSGYITSAIAVQAAREDLEKRGVLKTRKLIKAAIKQYGVLENNRHR